EAAGTHRPISRYDPSRRQAGIMTSESLQLLKNDLASRRVATKIAELESVARVCRVPTKCAARERDAEQRGVRCPLCGWRPTAASRWCCWWSDGPEPYFASCGAEWNTFSTRVRCPGCRHQWQWTSCLRCAEWSPHNEWYEAGEP